ncbi:DUF397 domain-containing protein [Amycolatopsis nigrescens]|uniref:DUF397 domain-containing protein n=1 Tax=Amycolatopsis nigrescens TaxID=381445 RepID=UPI0003A56231|nr:DUF397 domain-containing protein [Amycolatopsis nigrescens]
MTLSAHWRKSSHSGEASNCVEVACDKDVVQVRDSKDRLHGTLDLPLPAWSAFLSQVSGRE